jgi:hypothetical protein
MFGNFGGGMFGGGAGPPGKVGSFPSASKHALLRASDYVASV